MSNLANSNRVSVRYIKENQWGVKPNNPHMKEIRIVAESTKPGKETVESAVIRSDRQVESIIEVGLNASGSLKTELTSQSADLVAAALQSVFVTATKTASLTQAGQLVTFGSAEDYAAVAGANFIRISGAANAGNNGAKRVIARNAAAKTLTLAAGSIVADQAGTAIDHVFNLPAGDTSTLDMRDGPYHVAEVVRDTPAASGVDIYLGGVTPQTIINGGTVPINVSGGVGNVGVIDPGYVQTFNEVGGNYAASGAQTPTTGNPVVSCNYARNGVTPPSFTREVAFLDVGLFKSTTGERVTKMDLGIEAKKVVTLDFTTVSKDYAVAQQSIAAEVIPAEVETSASASANVGAITDGANPLATALLNFKLSLSNSERVRPQIGSLFTADFGFGKCVVTGSFSAYFANLDLSMKFCSHTAVDLMSVVALPVGKVLAVHVPSAQLSDDQADADGADKDIMEELQFKAQVHPQLGYTVQVDLI